MVLLSGGFFLFGRVDPGDGWQAWRGGGLADEALGVLAGRRRSGRGRGWPGRLRRCRGGRRRRCAGRARRGGARCCTRGRSPGSAPGRPRWSRSGPGNPGRYFRVLNWASEYGLSLLTCGPGVGLGDAEVGEQERDRLGGHRGAAVGVDGELPAADALLRRRSRRSVSPPGRRTRGWRPSSRRRTGSRCRGSRRGSSTSISPGRAAW